jgi:hypothetical protein
MAKIAAEIFFEDLSSAGVTKQMLDDACAKYRRDAANRFFPTPAHLLDLCAEDLTWRRKALAGLARAEMLLKAMQAKP